MIRRETSKTCSVLLIIALGIHQFSGALAQDNPSFVADKQTTDVADATAVLADPFTVIAATFLFNGTLGLATYGFNTLVDPTKEWTCKDATNAFIYSGALGVTYLTVGALLPVLGTMKKVAGIVTTTLGIASIVDPTAPNIAQAISDYVGQ